MSSEDQARRVLVADDDPGVRSALRGVLEDEGYTVVEASSGDEVQERLTGGASDLLLLDLVLPDTDGRELLAAIRRRRPELPVIVVTGHGSAEVAIDSIRRGAYDYLTKPFELDEVLVRVRHALHEVRLAEEVRQLQERLLDAVQEEMVGESSAMQGVYKTIGRVAHSDAPVLITGETGTGKELVARTIHRTSRRADGPFIAVNCAALPANLLESELFGHEKGAFTGAASRRQGRFELADGGTLFLDEIADMSLATQARVLRAVELGTFERVGGSRTLKVDARLVAATNHDLGQQVRRGRFREDLFYRLNVIAIQLPPLRQRREDIPLLVATFLNRRHGDRPTPARISEEALAALMEGDWPGNVRELANVIERAVALAQGRTIEPDHLVFAERLNHTNGALDPEAAVREGRPLKVFLERAEAELLEAALRYTEGRRREAAERLGISPRALAARLHRLRTP